MYKYSDLLKLNTIFVQSIVINAILKNMKSISILFILFITALTKLSASNIPPAPMGPEPPPGGDIGGIWIMVIIATIYGIIQKYKNHKKTILKI